MKTNTLIIELNKELKEGLNNGSIKAVDMNTYLLTRDEIKNPTNKDAYHVAMKELTINGGLIVGAQISWDGFIHIEYEVVEEVKTTTKQPKKANNKKVETMEYNGMIFKKLTKKQIEDIFNNCIFDIEYNFHLLLNPKNKKNNLYWYNSFNGQGYPTEAANMLQCIINNCKVDIYYKSN